MAGPHLAAFVVDAAHPALAGHFPGRPIVPGALLLDLVARVAAAAWPGMTVTALRQAKFTVPVLPGQVIDIALQPGPGAVLGFTCRHAGTTVAQGSFALQEPLP